MGSRTGNGVNAMNAWRETRIRQALLVIGAIVFLFASIRIADYYMDGYKNKKVYADFRSAYAQPLEEQLPEPAGTTAGTLADEPVEPIINPKIAALQETNKDIVGWVRIEGTPIDYPVVQGEDNAFYLKHDAEGGKNKAGSIFMDYRNDAGGDNRNTIVYGHYMKDGTMFGKLQNYESWWTFDRLKTIDFELLTGDEEWVVFSAYVADPSFDYIRTEFDSDEQFQSFLDDIQRRSLHPSTVKPTADDKILTLSTCSYDYDNARFVIHAVRR